VSDGFPLWRLMSTSGISAQCFLDPLPNGQWMLSIWHGNDLSMPEVVRDYGSGVERAERVRQTMLAEGWHQPVFRPSASGPNLLRLIRLNRGGMCVAFLHPVMRVQLTRKLADRIDGIDLKGQEVGTVLDLPEPEARLLLAEDWAIPERRAADRPRKVPTKEALPS
jgi:hypothetical protein